MKQMKELKGEKSLKKVMETTKTESGITLIALVIMIIILLILATVSISMLTGENGIITTAREAQTKTEQGEEKEQIALAYNSAITKKYADGTYDAKTGIKAADLTTELTAQKTNATAADGTEEKVGKIEVTFTDSSNKYTVDPATGKIEGPIEAE